MADPVKHAALLGFIRGLQKSIKHWDKSAKDSKDQTRVLYCTRKGVEERVALKEAQTNLRKLLVQK